jgi:hypothetical protein
VVPMVRIPPNARERAGGAVSPCRHDSADRLDRPSPPSPTSRREARAMSR